MPTWLGRPRCAQPGSVAAVRALLTRPKWLVLHALVLAVAAGMLWLGGWQWGRASDGGRVQNYAYAGQWLLFALFTVVAYAKLARDEVLPPVPAATEEQADLPVRAQPTAPIDVPGDAELEAYNAYLRHLAETST